MPTHIYKIEASSTSALEWLKASLEGVRFKMKKDSARKKWKSSAKSIDVEGKLDVFLKCKGPKNTEVTITVTKTDSTPVKKVLDEKKEIIGDDSNEAPKIGHLSIAVSPT